MTRKRLVSIALVGLLVVFMEGCNRKVPGLNDPEVAIDGYRIEGAIVDDFLRPLAGVQVILFYSLAFANGDSVDRAYSPSSPGEFVTVEVKSWTNQTVRVLFAGQAPQDSMLYVPWDGRDDSGSVVRSGIYTVTYTVSSVVRKSFRLIVHGNQNAVTDAEGKFVIPESDLPVDEIAPYYDSNDAFVGQFQFSDQVLLQFLSTSFSRTYRVALLKNKITNFSAVVN